MLGLVGMFWSRELLCLRWKSSSCIPLRISSMFHFMMWLRMLASLSFAKYGPIIEIKYSVVGTMTMGFTSGLPLWKLKDCLWNWRWHSCWSIQDKYHLRASRVMYHLITAILLQIPDLERLNKADNILFDSPPLSFISLSSLSSMRHSYINYLSFVYGWLSCQSECDVAENVEKFLTIKLNYLIEYLATSGMMEK